MQSTYETAAQTAKKVRKALKESFPGVKFSVRSESYSMGSSVSVGWADGPLTASVDAVLRRYQSASFDGMQDMKISHGYVDPADGQRYHGADYVSGERRLSPEYRARLVEFGRENWQDWEQFCRDMVSERAALLAAEKEMLKANPVAH